MQSPRATADRAEACVRCHAGDGLDREVNHDLIAAGHPRLRFEFASHSDRMPRHWDQAVTDAKREAGGFAARDPAGEWAVGQAASMAATLNALCFPGDHGDSPVSAGEPDPWADSPRPVVEAIRTLLEELTSDGDATDRPPDPGG